MSEATYMMLDRESARKCALNVLRHLQRSLHVNDEGSGRISCVRCEVTGATLTLTQPARNADGDCRILLEASGLLEGCNLWPRLAFDSLYEFNKSSDPYGGANVLATAFVKACHPDTLHTAIEAARSAGGEVKP